MLDYILSVIDIDLPLNVKIIIGFQGALLLILFVLWVKTILRKSKISKEAEFYKHKAIAAEALVKQLSDLVEKSGDTTSDMVGKLIDGFLRANGQEPTARRSDNGNVEKPNTGTGNGVEDSQVPGNIKRDSIQPHRKEDG